MEFGADHAAAERAYPLVEDEHRGKPAEVLLVGADSLDTVKKTHSQYFFTTTEELVDQFLAQLR